MPGTVITDDELNNLCEYIASTQYIYYPVAADFWSDMLETGCRPMELLTPALWTNNFDGSRTLQPLKGNSPRTIQDSALSPSLLFALNNGIQPYDQLSYRQLKAVMYKIIPVISIRTANKSAIDYIFRYNKVRQLSQSGQTAAQIQAAFGWSSAAFSTLYATTPVSYTGTLPPPVYNKIIDFDGTYVIDNNGNSLS